MKGTFAKPPKIPLHFLRWFCDPDMLEDIEGDLTELFGVRAKNKPRLAKFIFWLDVLIMFRPGVIRNFEYQKLNNYDMFKNYLIAAWRNLMKNKRFSSINIFSLTLGIAACIIIFLFVKEEQAFDAFHSRKDQIYRLCEVQSFPGTNTQKVALSMPGMGPTMKEEFPEIETYARFWSFRNQPARVGDKHFMIDKVRGVDSTFLSIFDFPIIAGDPSGKMDGKEAYITRSTATKLFGSIDVVGQQFEMDDDLLSVKGVLEDVPDGSHLQFDMLCSIYLGTDDPADFDHRFGSNYLNTYFILNDGANLEDMAQRYPEYLSRMMDNEDINDFYKLFLQPLEDVHLASTDIEHDYNNHRKFNGTYIDVFVLIGVFILIIASVNFMNLTTARASTRAKEVGVRKTIGALRNQLFFQFILESTIMALIAFALAIVIDFISIPSLNILIDRDFSMIQFVSSEFIVVAFLFTLALGIITGMYPALYLSSFRPVTVLKGLKSGEKKSLFRSSLIVLQFGLAVGLIVCTLVVVQQLNYMKNKDIGYSTDHIMVVSLNYDARDNYQQIKDELLKQSSVLGVTASGQRIGNNFHQWGFKVKKDTGIVDFTPSNVVVDYDYLDVYDIKLKDGRTFSKEHAKDNGLAFIVNEAFAKEIGFEDPLGQRVGHGWYPDDSLGTIIGVTEDFNFNSLHYKVNTLSMVVHSDWGYSEMSVKLNGSNIAQGIKEVESVYNQFVSNYPFEYEFLDDHFAELYKADNQLGSIITIIAVLAIMIGGMGLFGLASISINRRIKEIGIRKVLGASSKDLMVLLSKNFGILILISFVIAVPFTWIYLAGWLEGFAYRISINPLVFLLGGVMALVVAMITISLHVIRAAYSNPVTSLRYE
ncbi:ABC transporter permease [Marinoscillum pacificum]|uniref:ABC transporter permease n=1 Tax=Marinoscillum pacificum TaxID=392723 RepID=UPI0021574AE7|nr:FtsX-like permease family protein [Marinoscillum pacificum]